jgi:succinate-semialdehyde dehydrogenase / glutarate-semialdehyde dehydrogenase
VATLTRHPLVLAGARVETSTWDTVHDRATGEPIGEVAAATLTDVDTAVRAAVAALPDWAARAPGERAGHLLRYAALLREHAEHIATLIHREEGKPLAEAQAETARATEVVEYFAGEAERLATTHLGATSPTTGSFIRPAPIGVVAAITPWNFPVALVLWKLAPALAAGCTIVVKPAAEAPLAAWTLCHLAEQAGIPPGVVGCLTGDGPMIGEALATHPDVAKVAFTGSRRVAEQIAAWTAPRLKALTLELGGHGALVVMDDADLETAVDVALVQGYANAGQACYSVNRVLIGHARIDDFLERFRARMGSVVLGPMATDRGLARHHALLADARAKGATVEGGEEISPGRLAPTLVTNAGPGVSLIDEEPFTPIVAVMAVQDLEAAIAEANRPDYGLVNYICGADRDATMAATQALKSGTVVVNGWRVVVPYAPYAGWRGSGVGTELGRPGLESFIAWQHLRVLE